MAGLGKKTFAASEVLRAADVNGYLMDQSVQVYAGTAARGSAIGSAVSDGMVSYLKDIDSVQIYDGSGTWRTYGRSFATGSSSASTDASGLVTITHGLGVAPTAIFIQGAEGGALPSRVTYTVSTVSSTTFIVKAYRQDTGSAFGSNPVHFYWNAIV